ncbi:hypothetical protein B0H14DRAFT_2820152 [Mycena olivaceomarginata]|nr:hypothetical protein B0H14DRAFT_2820152 [Mycena olivaceomarginata]
MHHTMVPFVCGGATSRRWRSPHPSRRKSTDTQCLAVFALGMDGALADVLVYALASHHIHLCPDELEAPPAPLLLVHPQKTVKGVIPFPLPSHPPPASQGNNEAGDKGRESKMGRRIMMRGSRKNMADWGGDGVEDESSTPVLRYGESGACRLGVGWSGSPRLTWTSQCHRPTTRVKNRAGLPYAGMWGWGYETIGRDLRPRDYTSVGMSGTPTPGNAAHAAGREAQAVVPALCCPLSVTPSPHLRADVLCNPAVSIPARRDTSAAIGSLSSTSFHSICVSTPKFQQIVKTGQRRRG